MSQDVREYFRKWRTPEETHAIYTGNQLARGGINDMDTLCALLKQEPEKLRSLRNIGPKSMEIIHKVCAFYHSEKGEPL